MIQYLNHFRTWNLAHLDITYNTVPNRHFDVLEVHWSDYRPSPEACIDVHSTFRIMEPPLQSCLQTHTTWETQLCRPLYWTS